MKDLSGLRAAAEKAAAAKQEAEQALGDAKRERGNRFHRYNAARAEAMGIVFGETIIEYYQNRWDEEKGRRTRAVVMEPSTLWLDSVNVRAVTLKNKLHLGRQRRSRAVRIEDILPGPWDKVASE